MTDFDKNGIVLYKNNKIQLQYMRRGYKNVES